MSYDDFINTSILSIMSGGVISNLKMPSFSGNKKSQIRNLYQLSQNMDVLDANLNEMVSNKVITKEDADKVKKDAIAVSRNVTRIPKDTDPNIQLDVMRKLSDIQDLEDSKKTLDKSFHPQIDNQIQEKRNEVENIYKESLKTKPKEKAAAPEVVAKEEVVEEPTIKDSQIPLKRETFEFESAEGDILDVQVTTRKDGSRDFVAKDKDGRIVSSQKVGKDNTLTTEEYVTKGYGDIQGEPKVEQGNDIMAPAMKDKLTAQQKTELGIEVVAKEEVSKKSQENSLPLFEQLQATETTKQKNRLLRNNPTVAFVSQNLDTIIDSVEGAQRVEC
jgi:hypothetical protein